MMASMAHPEARAMIRSSGLTWYEASHEAAAAYLADLQGTLARAGPPGG